MVPSNFKPLLYLRKTFGEVQSNPFLWSILICHSTMRKNKTCWKNLCFLKNYRVKKHEVINHFIPRLFFLILLELFLWKLTTPGELGMEGESLNLSTTSILSRIFRYLLATFPLNYLLFLIALYVVPGSQLMRFNPPLELAFD